MRIKCPRLNPKEAESCRKSQKLPLKRKCSNKLEDRKLNRQKLLSKAGLQGTKDNNKGHLQQRMRDSKLELLKMRAAEVKVIEDDMILLVFVNIGIGLF